MVDVQSKQSENFARLVRLLIVTGEAVLRERFDSIHKCSDLPSVLATWEKHLRNPSTRLSHSQLAKLYHSAGGYGTSAEWDIILICKIFREICGLTAPVTGWFKLPNAPDTSLQADLARVNYYRNMFYGSVTKLELDDTSFTKLWDEISSALVNITSGISAANGAQWKKAIEEQLTSPINVSDENNLSQLDAWYRYDLKEYKTFHLHKETQNTKLTTKDNYACLLNLLFDVGNKALRKFFKSRWPVVLYNATGRAGTAWSDLPADGLQFLSVDTTLRLESHELLKVQDGDTSKWDLTILCKVLIHSSLQFVLRGSPEYRELIQLRTLRNSVVGHATKPELTHIEFNQAWQDASNALMQFGVQHQETANIITDLEQTRRQGDIYHQQLLDSIAETNFCVTYLRSNDVHLKSINQKMGDLLLKQVQMEEKENEEKIRTQVAPVSLPDVPPHFTGRVKYLSDVIEHVSSSSTRLLTIWGLGGFGKTALAVSAGHRLHQEGIKTWFVSLREVNSIEGMIEVLLGVVVPNYLAGKGRNELLTQLCAHFRSITNTSVLIIDNVDDLLASPETKSKLLGILEKLLQQNRNLSIISTSREAMKFAKHNLKSADLLIGKLQTHESMELLANLVETQDLSFAEKECAELINYCDNAPLALKLLAAVIDQDRITPTEILYDLERSNILKVVDSEDYPDDQRMWKVFEASFFRLSEECQRIFICLSIFPSSFDANAAAAVLSVGHGLEVKKKLGLLERKAFVEYDGSKGRYSIHTLLQAFAELLCENKHEICAYRGQSYVHCQTYFFKLLEDLNNRFLTGQSVNAMQSFYNEKENLLFCLQEVTCDMRLPKIIEELTNMDIFLDTVFWNDPKTMCDVYDRFLNKCKKKNMQCCYAKVLLSKCFGILHWEENLADELLSEALNAINKVSSIPPGMRGKLLCFVAFRKMMLNHVDEAVGLFEKGIPFLNSHLSQLAIKAVSLRVLADCYELNQQTDKASSTMRQVSTLSQKHQGFIAVTQQLQHQVNSSNHPFLCATTYFLSNFLRTPSTKQRVRDIILNTAKDTEEQRKNSGDRLVIATHYDMLASSLEQIGCREELAIRRGALDIRLNLLGENNEHTAWSYHNLGLTHGKRGEYGDAVLAHRHALDIRVKLLGENHEDTALSYNNIGMAVYMTGDYSTAVNAHKRALEIRRSVLGENNEYTAWSYHNLGMTYYTLGHYSNAGVAHKHALEIRRKLLGELNEDTAWSYHNLGETHYMLDDLSSALDAEKHALDIRIKILGEHDEDTARSYHNLGEMYYLLGDYRSALDAERHALAIRIKLHGENNEDTAWSYHNLGMTLYLLGDYDTAVDAHKHALDIRVRLLGEGNEYTVWSCRNLDITRSKLGSCSILTDNYTY